MNKDKLPDNFILYEFDELESTMITLKEMAMEDAKIGTIVCAKKQNSGRGRHGREWVSPEGNLYFSFLRNAESNKSENIFAPVFIVAVALAEAINSFSNNQSDIKIKWPNDILINNLKLAGILIENFVNNKNQNLLNIGIGINIISNPKQTIYPSTNLNREGIYVSSNEILIKFFNFINYFEDILANLGINQIYNNWNKYSLDKGTKISVKVGDKKINGKYNGIDEKGSLLLEVEGKNEKILAGDIFVL